MKVILFTRMDVTYFLLIEIKIAYNEKKFDCIIVITEGK